jgi:hypothetical protein
VVPIAALKQNRLFASKGPFGALFLLVREKGSVQKGKGSVHEFRKFLQLYSPFPNLNFFSQIYLVRLGGRSSDTSVADLARLDEEISIVACGGDQAGH